MGEVKRMKLIDVLEKLSRGEIKNGTILTLKKDSGVIYQYKYVDNCFLDDCYFPLNVYSYSENDLNREVTIIEPIPNEYYLRLDEDDELSYVVRSSYSADFNYDFGGKIDLCEFTTKFTQEEIDNDKFLKFIEQHGIKEEVE